MTQDIIEVVEAAVHRAFDRRVATPWLDSDGAAEYLGCAAGTLKTWRARGEGPSYHVIQSRLVRYHVNDLDAFVRGEVSR